MSFSSHASVGGCPLRLKRCETTPETWRLHCRFRSVAPWHCCAVWEYALIWECWQFKGLCRKRLSDDFRRVLIGNTVTVNKKSRRSRMLACSWTLLRADLHTETQAQMLSIMKGLGVMFCSHQSSSLFNYDPVQSAFTVLSFVKYESSSWRFTVMPCFSINLIIRVKIISLV